MFVEEVGELQYIDSLC